MSPKNLKKKGDDIIRLTAVQMRKVFNLSPEPCLRNRNPSKSACHHRVDTELSVKSIKSSKKSGNFRNFFEFQKKYKKLKIAKFGEIEKNDNPTEMKNFGVLGFNKRSSSNVLTLFKSKWQKFVPTISKFLLKLFKIAKNI